MGLLLDMDGTVIGDTAFLFSWICYNRVDFQQLYSQKENVCMKREQIDFQDELKNGLYIIVKNASKSSFIQMPHTNGRPIFTREKSISWTKIIINNLHDYKKIQIVCPEYKFTPYYNIQY